MIHDLTGGELIHVSRRLFSFIESESKLHRYPVHFEDVQKMPNKEQILSELSQNRDSSFKLIPEAVPEIGKAKFAEYFEATIGSTLYEKFMAQYTQKMWNIPGTSLETSMVWADRFNHQYGSGNDKWIYDPLKFEDHTLGKGIDFQIYPRGGWNTVWDRMASKANLIVGRVESAVVSRSRATIGLSDGTTLESKNYDVVVNTLDLDEILGKEALPYTGRLIIPFLVPQIDYVLPLSAESIHYSGAEFMTRITEMKRITQHQSDDSLILIEVPVLPGVDQHLPENVVSWAKDKNLFAEKAYPQQSKDAISHHQSLVEITSEVSNWANVGRHAQFKYWGMPETVHSSYLFARNFD